MPMFIPSKNAATDRVNQYISEKLIHYQSKRNHDFGGVDAIINKIKNLSAHTEIDRPEISNPEKIQKLISERKDILLRGETFEFIEPTLNKYLPKNYKMLTDK